MPPRINCSARSSVSRVLQRTTSYQKPTVILLQSSRGASRHYASASASPIPNGPLRLPDNYVPPTQPPSARRPDQRKSQLLRSYTALLRSTPLTLFFQHNNLTAPEWAAIRRELREGLAKIPAPVAGPGDSGSSKPIDISGNIELQVLRTRIFNVAFQIVEFFDADAQKSISNAYTHDLSSAAYKAIGKAAAAADESSAYAQVAPLLIGPLAAITFPAISPAHLAAVLSVLAPSPPTFPAPSRKKNPGYYDLTAQGGLQKLLLVGSRIEDRVFDQEGVRWVGSISGGVDSLRAQLIAMLQSAGLGLTTALEGHGKGLWLALEGRRTQLEEEANGGAKKEEETNE
ncbi:hypothetical protein F4814DRAFT_426420 [Daldinia grandis]|nr:hypothetical protein F4814DRAFT_426420 [Daldinia grandis]